MRRIYLMLTMITNKETWSQLVINMILKIKLTTKMLLCNQEMEDTQLCSVNRNIIYQKMLKTFQTQIMIINKEMFFQLDTSTIHRAKLIIKTQLCNQEMVNIQLCSVNRNITYQRMLRIYLMSITTTNKET